MVPNEAFDYSLNFPFYNRTHPAISTEGQQGPLALSNEPCPANLPLQPEQEVQTRRRLIALLNANLVHKWRHASDARLLDSKRRDPQAEFVSRPLWRRV